MNGNKVPSPDIIDALEEKRNILHELLKSIEVEIPRLLDSADSSNSSDEQQLNSEPHKVDGPVRKVKFDF